MGDINDDVHIDDVKHLPLAMPIASVLMMGAGIAESNADAIRIT
jgi:hypothetical protein